MARHEYSVKFVGDLTGSRAEIKRALSEEISETKRRKLFEKIKTTNLFSKQEIDQLKQSMEISAAGIARYRFETTLTSVLKGVPVAAREKRIESTTLSDCVKEIESANEIDILCVNSCYHFLVDAIYPLFQNKAVKIRMKHVLDIDAFSKHTATFVSTFFHFLFDNRYEPYGMEHDPESVTYPIGGNALFIRARFAHQTKQFFFILSGNGVCHEMKEAREADIFEFLTFSLETLDPKPVPLKELSIQNWDYTGLCMNFLSYELNRSTYSLSNDLSVQQIPCDIAIAALRQSGMFSEEEIRKLIQHTLAIHEQRYQNLYTKKKDAYRVMTLSGCERFLQTGLTTDHFAGFRPFLPDERKRIFEEMLHAAKTNPFFFLHLIKEDDFHFEYNLVCYDKLGICIDQSNSDYNLNGEYKVFFLTMPEFTQNCLDYFLQTLVQKKCYSTQESIALLEELFERFLKEYSLN